MSRQNIAINNFAATHPREIMSTGGPGEHPDVHNAIPPLSPGEQATNPTHPDTTVPQLLQGGVLMLKISEKRQKKVVFKVDPDQGQILYESKKNGVGKSVCQLEPLLSRFYSVNDLNVRSSDRDDQGNSFWS